MMTKIVNNTIGTKPLLNKIDKINYALKHVADIEQITHGALSILSNLYSINLKCKSHMDIICKIQNKQNLRLAFEKMIFSKKNTNKPINDSQMLIFK